MVDPLTPLLAVNNALNTEFIQYVTLSDVEEPSQGNDYQEKSSLLLKESVPFIQAPTRYPTP